MGAQNITVGNTVSPGAIHNDWWGHHLRGGCRIGGLADQAKSVYSGYNQLYLSTTAGSNYFGAGEITNSTGDTISSGTHAAGPQSYRAAEGMINYLSNHRGTNFLL